MLDGLLILGIIAGYAVGLLLLIGGIIQGVWLAALLAVVPFACSTTILIIIINFLRENKR